MTEPDPTDAHAESRRLEVLVGRWRTHGSVRASDGAPSVRIEAVDTYEWLPGRHALLHRVDAMVGDVEVEGAEIIGFDPDLGSYATLYFGSDGPNRYEATLEERDGGLMWTMRSERDRFAGTFSEDRNTITGHWERLGDGWLPWMDIALDRQPGAAVPEARGLT